MYMDLLWIDYVFGYGLAFGRPGVRLPEKPTSGLQYSCSDQEFRLFVLTIAAPIDREEKDMGFETLKVVHFLLSFSLSLSLYIYIYIERERCIYTYIYIYMYICIFCLLVCFKRNYIMRTDRMSRFIKGGGVVQWK